MWTINQQKGKSIDRTTNQQNCYKIITAEHKGLYLEIGCMYYGYVYHSKYLLDYDTTQKNKMLYF